MAGGGSAKGAPEDATAAAVAHENRTSRRRQATHERLLSAARELLMESGPGNYTVADLAERADVGVGTVYNHFTDWRDEPLAELCHRAIDGWRRVTEAAVAQEGPGGVAAAAAAVVRERAKSSESGFNSMQLLHTLMQTPQWPQIEAIAAAREFVDAGIADGSFDANLDAQLAGAALVGFQG